MWLSKVDFDKKQLSDEQIFQFVFGETYDKIQKSDAAIVLGSAPERAVCRAKMAASFYKNGGADKLVVTGGVKHAFDGKMLMESEIMRDALIAEGVPESAIIMENRARWTIENMIFSYPELVWKFRAENVNSVTIITDASHMQRSLRIAKIFLPQFIKIYGYTENSEAQKSEFLQSEEMRERATNEVRYTQELILNGWTGDIEI